MHTQSLTFSDKSLFKWMVALGFFSIMLLLVGWLLTWEPGHFTVHVDLPEHMPRNLFRVDVWQDPRSPPADMQGLLPSNPATAQSSAISGPMSGGMAPPDGLGEPAVSWFDWLEPDRLTRIAASLATLLGSVTAMLTALVGVIGACRKVKDAWRTKSSD